MADTDRPLGQDILDRVGPRTGRWLAFGAAGLAVAMIAIVGLNQSVSSVAAPAPVPTSTNADAIVVPEDACADPAVHEAVQDALAQPNESDENAILALPSEVDAQDREVQQRAWLELSDEKRSFQLCLRLFQDKIQN